MANQLIRDVKEVTRRLRNRGISFDANRQYPSIPTIDDTIQSHTNALRAIRECIELSERRNPKAPLDSFVRLYELEDVLGGFQAGETTINYVTNVEGGTPTFMGASARRAANLTVAAGATVPLDFDFEIYDTDSIWSIADANRFVAPVDGYYFLLVTVYWNTDAASVGGRGLLVTKNNTLGPESGLVVASEVRGQCQQVMAHAQMNANDYFAVSVSATNAAVIDCLTQNAVAAFYSLSGTRGPQGVRGPPGPPGIGIDMWLDDLQDVVITDPKPDDVLAFNGDDWINRPQTYITDGGNF